ncbi:hypothetical protein ACIA8C_27115 [Nocardia sp. NPDC051321]|uniref:hypothetical protein n=1 Tax=Nocardia sp. NPDC051321 TaxID=3364323 RepID=UPI00378883F3
MPALLNLPLAALVLHTLRAKPHLHDHTVWADERPEGIAHSVAGWTVTLVGAVWVPVCGFVSWRGKLRSVPVLARELLGLSPSEAHMLIYHCNEEQAVNLLGHWVDAACVQQYRRLAAMEAELEKAS